MITAHPARVLRLSDLRAQRRLTGRPGGVGLERVEDVAASLPPRVVVVKNGVVTVSCERRVRERWREGP